jgi:uncharacterized lipoprotein YmbA
MQVLVVALALTACSVSPTPPERYYRVEIPATAGTASFKHQIVVEPFEVYGAYSERPLLFRSADKDSALEQYHYQYWVEPPAIMLRDSLVACLRNAFGAAQVLASGSRVRGDLIVRPRLKRFEHVTGGSGPRAAFSAEFTVTDNANNLLFVLDFNDEATAAGSSVEDYIAAMNGLVAKAYARLSERLRDAVPFRG